MLAARPATAQKKSSILYRRCNALSVPTLFVRSRSGKDCDAVRSLLRYGLSATHLDHGVTELIVWLSDFFFGGEGVVSTILIESILDHSQLSILPHKLHGNQTCWSFPRRFGVHW